MTEFSVIPARVFDCGRMSRLLRSEHAQAIAMIGIDSHRELREKFDLSSFRRSWFIDGDLAGLGGVTGDRLSASGFIWLALSNKAMKYPISIVREARRQLEEIMEVKRELVTTIIDGDESSKRFAAFLGLFPADAYAYSPSVASRYGRRQILSAFERTESRMVYGRGVCTIVSYRLEAA
jgi:hypothetical protein